MDDKTDAQNRQNILKSAESGWLGKNWWIRYSDKTRSYLAYWIIDSVQNQPMNLGIGEGSCLRNALRRVDLMNTKWGLPVYVAEIIAPGFGHADCALQLKKDRYKLDSWRIFQYNNSDIQVGDWQMPHGSNVEIRLKIIEVFPDSVQFSNDPSDIIGFEV